MLKRTTVWMALALSLTGCASIAELVETEVPDVVHPEVHEFDLELAGGEVVECKAVYLQLDWLDGSQTVWIWTTAESDPACEPEMERLADPSGGGS